jgi:hypothetical protein
MKGPKAGGTHLLISCTMARRVVRQKKVIDLLDIKSNEVIIYFVL